jgi:hypothetical protein
VVVIRTGWVGNTAKLQGASEEGFRIISVGSK